MQRAAEKR
ncbi:hypothetical protein LTT89_24760 [Escherichia coli]|nr:hypothetical protein [Escherichia coli]